MRRPRLPASKWTDHQHRLNRCRPATKSAEVLHRTPSCHRQMSMAMTTRVRGPGRLREAGGRDGALITNKKPDQGRAFSHRRKREVPDAAGSRSNNTCDTHTLNGGGLTARYRHRTRQAAHCVRFALCHTGRPGTRLAERMVLRASHCKVLPNGVQTIVISLHRKAGESPRCEGCTLGDDRERQSPGLTHIGRRVRTGLCAGELTCSQRHE